MSNVLDNTQFGESLDNLCPSKDETTRLAATDLLHSSAIGHDAENTSIPNIDNSHLEDLFRIVAFSQGELRTKLTAVLECMKKQMPVPKTAIAPQTAQEEAIIHPSVFAGNNVFPGVHTKSWTTEGRSLRNSSL